MVALLGINHDGPILMEQVGHGHQGITWIVAPENHAAAIDTVNKYGGTHAWRITPLTHAEAEELSARRG